MAAKQIGQLGMKQKAAFGHQLPDLRQQKEARDNKHENRQKHAPHHLNGPCGSQEIRSQAATFFDDITADAQIRQHGQACGNGKGEGHQAKITGDQQPRHDKAGAKPDQGSQPHDQSRSTCRRSLSLPAVR